MKTAVVYYSLEGNVQYVAGKIAAAIGADLIRLVPVKAYPDKGFKKFLWGGKAATMKEKPELEPYRFPEAEFDKVILCTPVWAGTFTPPLRTFLQDHDLAGKKVAVIVSCSGGNTQKCISQIREAAHADALIAELSLVDPKSRPSAENEKRIQAFVNELRKK